MAVEIQVVYEGDLHCSATHGPSGNTLPTDAPVDNQGKGEAFSPTDLVATALATCVLTTMGIVARRNELDIAGTRARVTKEMVNTPVRRIGRLDLVVTFPAEKARKLSATDRSKLEAAGHHCPVHQSLHPAVEAPITFIYED